MNILIYAHSFAPHIGGAEKYVLLLAQGLAGRPEIRQVTVATPTPAGGFDDGALPFRVVRRPGPRTLWRLIGAADVVQLAGPCFVPLALALLRRKPVAIEHHTYQAVCPNGLLYYHPRDQVCPGHFAAKRYALCLRCNRGQVGRLGSARSLLLAFPRFWMCRRATANIAVSCHVAQRLELPRTVTIPHGIPDLPPAAKGRQASGASSAVPCFVFVGRFVREKGLAVLLEAARLLLDEGFDFRLRLVGDGPERTALERAASNLGVLGCVEFTGFLTGDKLDRALCESAAVIIPSKWEELAPLVAIENMMRGLCVIVSDIGGLGEEVDGTGLKFQPGDARSLAECMQKVILEPSLRQAAGARGRERALKFYRQERMVTEHLDLYCRIRRPSAPSA